MMEFSQFVEVCETKILDSFLFALYGAYCFSEKSFHNVNLSCPLLQDDFV